MIVTKQMIKGFSDTAKEAGTMVTGGQTIFNPWPIIGGVAMSTRRAADIIRPENAIPGDVLVLTKPLGTQVAVNLHQWYLKQNARWEQVKHLVTVEDVNAAYNAASKQMARLNKLGAELMQKYQAHAATDVTGFGILGHGRNLASNQKAKVVFEFHTLPMIKNMPKVEEVGKIFRLMDGLSAETSGGLLVALPAAAAEAFVRELSEREAPAWVIGNVRAQDQDSPNTANILPNVTILEV